MIDSRDSIMITFHVLYTEKEQQVKHTFEVVEGSGKGSNENQKLTGNKVADSSPRTSCRNLGEE